MPPLSPLELTVGFLSGAVTRGILVGFVTYAAIWILQITPFQVAQLWAVLYYSVVASLFMGAVGLHRRHLGRQVRPHGRGAELRHHAADHAVGHLLSDRPPARALRHRSATATRSST